MENKTEIKLTPLMRQYFDIKEKYPDDILFFRLGDFYEMFFDDAKKASSILDITLTKRNDVPMCGIPFHSSESYIARLIKGGENVAICEQMEGEPSDGKIVKREVVRVITPGTVTEQNLLSGDSNNFLLSIVVAEEKIAIAAADVSTGEFLINICENNYDIYRSEVMRFSPSEALFLDISKNGDERYEKYLSLRAIKLGRINEWLYDEEYLVKTIETSFSVNSLKGLGIEEKPEILAAGSLLAYIKNRCRNTLAVLKIPRISAPSDRLILDEAALANLEIARNNTDGGKARTLYSVIERSVTSSGKRFLENALLRPLAKRNEIEDRLDCVDELFSNHVLLENVINTLSSVKDIERIIARIVASRNVPADYKSLAESLKSAKMLKTILASAKKLSERSQLITDFDTLTDLIDSAICDEPATDPESGRVIREGFDPELDRLHSLKKDGRDWILNYEAEEKERLGIPTLKVRYNRIFGYYIEISKGQSDKAPADYIRKQTLVNAERFTTEKLQTYETDILESREKCELLENKILQNIADEILTEREHIIRTAEIIAEIDFYSSNARIALQNNFIRPVFNDNGEMNISGARHPVVEKFLNGEPFIPNDIVFSSGDIVKIITGPNMAGKSTYIRTAAVLQIMAQTGLFVPAQKALMPVCDRVYARIGASDNIARGESTFLVEMTETASILNSATERSLIIMDEVGRGTSTYDGLSLAKAIVEYIHKRIGAKTFFATHYHELTSLDETEGFENLTVMVRENKSGVEFMHKVIKGSADKSYGVHVASLAGIPGEITIKAKRYLDRFEKTSAEKKTKQKEDPSSNLELFNMANHTVINAIKNIDTNRITPIEALNEINRLKKMIEE